MLHRISRLLGVWLLLIAMVALVVDATKTLGAGGAMVVTPLAADWRNLLPGTYEAAETFVAAKLGPTFWDAALLPILHLPAWLLFGLLGVLLYWLGQKRRAQEVFIN